VSCDGRWPFAEERTSAVALASVTVILPTALSGTWNNDRRANLDRRAALILGGCGLGTGIVGGIIADHMSPTTSNLLFGGLLVLVAARQIQAATHTSDDDDDETR